LLTIFVGADAPDDERDALAAALEAAFPDLTLEMIAGGQRGVRYVLGVE
jgi:dihydroxyacetone kinase-like predicted kinase